MSDSAPKPTTGAVFLSYAREDTDAARRIADALRSQGIEVWFDQNELRGGDAWDQKIRKQIADCTLFLPVISRNTQGRSKGYFRLEWKLAVENTHLMAEGVPYLAPIVIDDTSESGAVVPPEFLKVQWTRLPGALPTPQFVGQIKRLLEAPQTGGVARSTAATRSKPAAVTRSGAPRLALGLVAAVGVAAAVFVALRPTGSETAPSVKTVAPSVRTAEPVGSNAKSVAVLAFADLSEKKDSEYLSDGISEEILNVLAKVPGLSVKGRTSSFFFKGKNLPIPEIGQKLNAAYVVEGSVQRFGERVKITAQLIRAADDEHLWSETFTREMKDVLALEEEIAGLVVKNLSAKLGVRLAPVAATVPPTKNSVAYEAYLRARAVQVSDSGNAQLDAVKLYEGVVRLDPEFALAWARLAEVCATLWFGGFDRSEAHVVKARLAVATALRLNPKLPEARLAQARIYARVDLDREAARRELDLLEQLRPNDVELPAVRVDLAYASGDRGETLFALVRQAVDADPQNAGMLANMGTILYARGRYSDADELFERARQAGLALDVYVRSQVLNRMRWTGDLEAALALLETTPLEARARTRFYSQRADLRQRRGDLSGALDDYANYRRERSDLIRERSGPRGVAVYSLLMMARIERQLGHAARATQLEDEALKEMDAYDRDFPADHRTKGYRALLLARRGQVNEAWAAFETYRRDLRQQQTAETILQVRRSHARLLAVLGRHDEAIAELKALQDAGHLFGYDLRGDLELIPLHPDPRFQQLMATAEAQANAQPRPKK